MPGKNAKISRTWTLVTIGIVAFGLHRAWLWVAYAPTTEAQFFAQRFPASSRFHSELELMRQTGRLAVAEENAILHATTQTSKVLEIPPALLWCLLFQESRLNHLLGLDGNIPSYGLGQFTHFGFYEINYQLNRYSNSHKHALVRLLGRDVRPIAAEGTQPQDGSSYFSIPTAVVATGLYLKNRYLHLAKLLNQRGLRYDPQILWLYAVMAYNKGTRGILNFWNAEEQRYGTKRLRRLLTDEKTLMALGRDSRSFTAGFTPIWGKRRANHYSKELSIHLANISACALSPAQRSQP